MDHAHHWRATSKVFALTCECGIVYHDWLLAEVERLKTAAAPASPSISAEEVAALRTQLNDVCRERDMLLAELVEARAELEKQAAAITQSVTSAVQTS
jgi:hypothetical protein